MSRLDEIRETFGKNLDTRRKRHIDQTEEDLRRLRQRQYRKNKPSKLDKIDLNRLLSSTENQRANLIVKPQIRSLMADITESDIRYQMDTAFTRAFNFGTYYSLDELKCPSYICETTEEYIKPQLDYQKISDQEKERIIAEAKREGYIHPSLGIYLPGSGAYINGYLIAKKYNIPSKTNNLQEHEQARKQILETLAHEKLGHGLLAAYSSLGKVEEEIGKTRLSIADSFGLQDSDDPSFKIRERQNHILLSQSLILEEGWSTWVETYLLDLLEEEVKHPKYNFEIFKKNLLTLDPQLRNENIKNLMIAFMKIWNEENISLEDLHGWVQFLAHCEEFMDIQIGFLELFGQPLRYVVGNLIISLAELNLGAKCVPYAALIAANITLDPTKIGIYDLAHLLATDKTLNPNTRMTALSRLRLETPNSVAELAERAESELSLSVPKELKANS